MKAVTTFLLSVAFASSANEAFATQVVFDQAHGQRFLIERTEPLQLSKFAEVFRKGGATVESTKARLDEKTLAKADALISSGPFAKFEPSEIDAIVRFIERGGRFCLTLHVGPITTPLLDKLGVVVSNGVIHEGEHTIHDRSSDFAVTRLLKHPVTDRIDSFNLFGTWALLNTKKHASLIAQTSPHAWADLNRNRKQDRKEPMQSFGVAVAGTLGRGAFVVFGDDAIFQNRFLSEGNRKLAENLARWVAGNDKPPQATGTEAK